MSSLHRSASLGGACALAALVILSAAPAPAQEAPAAPPAVEVRPRDSNLPIDQDPNDPLASRAERIERNRQLMLRMAEERRRNEAAAAEQERARLAAPPEPTPLPAATPAVTATPSPEQQRNVTMFMSPAAQALRVGERFATQWRMINPGHLPVDRVDLAMDFPAEALRPVAVHHGALSDLLAEQPEVLHDEAAGQLIYRARLIEPVSVAQLELLTVEWEALRAAHAARIEPRVAETASAAWLGNRRQTETMSGMPDAIVGAEVQINERPSGVPEGYRMVSPHLADLQPLLAGLPDQSRLRPPTLWIDQPAGERLEAGQWLMVDVGLDNPDKMVFDELRLALRFDPALVEVVDHERNNAISRGVNVNDGMYRRQWGWTRFFANEVNNTYGTIFYHVGQAELGEQPSGPVVRVLLRVRRPTTAPVLHWLWITGQAGAPTTGVYLMGHNVHLRDSGDPALSRFSPAVNPRRIALGARSAEKADPAIYRNGGAAAAGGAGE